MNDVLVAPMIAVTLIALVFMSAVRGVVTTETVGWMRVLTRWFVHAAARRLPADSDRYEEEWLAELQALEDRPITMLLHAYGIFRSRDRVQLELREPEKEGSDVRFIFVSDHGIGESATDEVRVAINGRAVVRVRGELIPSSRN